jgi:outer membrane protein assembly factor BamB
MSLRSLPRHGRKALIAGLSAVLLAASGVTVWRVLRPTEVVASATTAYPEETIPVPGRVGSLISAPLIVDDRLRVYAKKREVWSDGPPSYHYERSAYWSYRRWPAQVTEIALVNQGNRPLIVTSWTDGLLVALDAETGEVAWRTQGDTLADEYIGRRTGAQTVYPTSGLLTTDTGFLTSHSTFIRGYSADGAETWKHQTPVTPECHGTEFTTESQWLVLDTCTKTLKRIDARDGKALSELQHEAATVEPIACVSGHSQCRAMRTTGETTQGWILDSPEPRESKPLASPGSTLVQNLVVTNDTPTTVTGRDPGTGEPRWTWEAPNPVQLLAAGTDRVFVLLTNRTLAGLDLETGENLTRSGVKGPGEPDDPYAISTIYTANRYIVLERVNPDVPAEANDDTYYFTHRPVLVAIA